MSYPFVVDSSDHCETPLRAYKHISPLLEQIALLHGLSKCKLRIYDPYYCRGTVVERLRSLGFPQVHNVKQDFYRCIKDGRVPAHDVLLTNPPYSADHLFRILTYCCHGLMNAEELNTKHKQQKKSLTCKPWLLLLPSYVYVKRWFGKMMKAANEIPVFLCPRGEKYQYDSFYEQSGPEARSPFPSFWYIGGLGELKQPLLAWWEREGKVSIPECSLACCIEELPRAIKKLERYAETKNQKKTVELQRKRKSLEKKARREAKKAARLQSSLAPSPMQSTTEANKQQKPSAKKATSKGRKRSAIADSTAVVEPTTIKVKKKRRKGGEGVR